MSFTIEEIKTNDGGRTDTSISAAESDQPGEFYCPECGRQCSRGPSGTEYGHDNGGETGTSRCSRRPRVVDSDEDGFHTPNHPHTERDAGGRFTA